MACTGHRVLQARDRRDQGPRDAGSTTELEQRLPDFDEDVRIHVNGCPNSCARFQVADIGLMSALRARPDGTKSDAFLVHLGGTMGEGAAFGRKVKGVKIYAEDAADYLELLLRRYRQQRADGDSFSSFVNAPRRRRAGTVRGARGRPRGAAMTRVRAVPFYCPFCGEQDIRPDDAATTAWRCESCERGFESDRDRPSGGEG